MPLKDPNFWRLLAEQGYALAGGAISALLHLGVAILAPRPWPPGMLRAAMIEAVLALTVGILAGIFLGPLVAHFFHLTGGEAVGGVKTIIAVIAWKALPVVRDGAGAALAGLLKRKTEEL